MTTGIADKSKESEEKVQGATPAPETRTTATGEHTEAKTRTYTQEELDARLGKAGGKMKAQLELITKERDDFRGKHESAIKSSESLQTEITKAKERITELDDTLESLDSGDAAKTRDLIRKWEKRLAGLEEREKTLLPREERVNTFERTELVYSVADEYGLDEAEAKDKFKAAADKLGIKDRDALVILAESMNLSPRDEEAEEEKPKKPKAPMTYSGKSDGGTPYFTRAQIADRSFWEAHKDEILKAQKEGRIRD